MHGSSVAAALAARTPARSTPPPRGHRDPRGEDQQADRPAPASPPESCTWAVAGAEGLRTIPGPIAARQGPSCPRCAGPTVSTRPSRIPPCGGGLQEARPALAEAPPKPAEAAIVAGLRPPGGEGGLGLLMPGFFHKELRRVWASPTSARGADPADSPWGPALQERRRRTSTASSRTCTSYGEPVQVPPGQILARRAWDARAPRGGPWSASTRSSKPHPVPV